MPFSLFIVNNNSIHVYSRKFVRKPFIELFRSYNCISFVMKINSLIYVFVTVKDRVDLSVSMHLRKSRKKPDILSIR